MDNSDEDDVKVLHNNWMSETQKGDISLDEDPEMKKLKLNLISRHENVQVQLFSLTTRPINQ